MDEDTCTEEEKELQNREGASPLPIAATTDTVMDNERIPSMPAPASTVSSPAPAPTSPTKGSTNTNTTTTTNTSINSDEPFESEDTKMNSTADTATMHDDSVLSPYDIPAATATATSLGTPLEDPTFASSPSPVLETTATATLVDDDDDDGNDDDGNDGDVELGTTKNEMKSASASSSSSSSSLQLAPETPVYPDVFYCPITNQLMEDPVVLRSGISYERSALEVSPGIVPTWNGTSTSSTSNSSNNNNGESDDNDIAPMAGTNSNSKKKKRNQASESSSSSSSPTNHSTPSIPMGYSNRALMEIMEETIQLEAKGVEGTLNRFQYSVNRTMNNLLDQSAIPSDPSLYRPLSDAYYCPLTFDLMHQPVIDPEGNTFERVAVEQWISSNGTSPVTRTKLSCHQLYPNLAIQYLLDEKVRNKSDEELEQIHPTLLEWKHEPPPQPIVTSRNGNNNNRNRNSSADGNDPNNNNNNDNNNNGDDNGNNHPFHPSIHWPSNPQELEDEQRRRYQQHNRRTMTLLGIMLVGLFVLYWMLHGFPYLFCCILLCIVSCNSRGTHRRYQNPSP